MEDIEIKIPKLSLFKDEDKLFEDLLAYLAVLESLFNGRNIPGVTGTEHFLFREQRFIESLHHDDIEKVIYALQMIVSTNAVRTERESIFSTGFLSSCRKDKKKMQQLVEKYQKQIEKVRECQRSVWVTRAKVQKYSLMVHAAETSINNYIHDKKEFRERNNAIKEIKRDLGVRMKRHTANTMAYEKALLKENVIRKRLTTLSSSMEESITAKIKSKINNTMGLDVNGNANVSHADTISKSLYGIISHSFVLVKPASDYTSPDFNKVISYPDVVQYMFSQESIKKVMKYNTPTKKRVIVDPHNLDSGDMVQNKIGVERLQTDARTDPAPKQQKKGFFHRRKSRKSGKYEV